VQLAVTHKAPRSSVRRSQLIRVAFIRSSELRRHESKFGEQKAASKSLVSEVLARCWLVRVTLVRLRVRDVTLVATLVGDQVIRGDPAQHGSLAGAPKNRQRILSVRRSGWMVS